jgi:hypothetical protein
MGEVAISDVLYGVIFDKRAPYQSVKIINPTVLIIKTAQFFTHCVKRVKAKWRKSFGWTLRQNEILHRKVIYATGNAKREF